MSGAVGYVADASCKINTTLQSGYVCLGPGKLCAGGRYVSGDYDSAKCAYDVNFSPYVLLILIILCVITFDELRSLLENKVPKDYRPVITSFFAELATLGFVSLVVFLVERSWVPNGKSAIDNIAENLNLGYMLKKTLHRLHFQLFGVSVCFIIMSLLLLRYLLIEFGRFKKWSVQLEEGIGDFHHLPKIGIVKVDTRWTFLLPHRIKQEREIFLRLFERFTDPKQITPGDIPVKPTFSLGEYFMLCSSHTVSHILHINPYDWVFVLILSLWPFLAYYGSTGLSSDNPDASFPVFWLYEALLLVFSLFLDWKIHNILMSIVPTETIFESNLAASVEDLPDYARDDKTEGGGQSNLELPGFSKLGGLLDREGVSSGRSPRQSNGHGSSQNLDLSKLVEPRKVHGQLGSIPGGDGKSIKCSGSTPTLGADKVCVNSNGGVDHGAGVLSAGDVVVEVIPIGRSASDRDVEWTREEVVGIDAARESKKGCDISKLLKIPVGSYECDAISPASNGPPSNGNGALQAPNGTLQDTPTEVESTIHSAVESAAKKKDAIADSSVPPSGMVTIAELAVVSTEIESGADAAIESSTAVTQNLVSGSYFGFGRNTTEEMSESSRVGDSPSNQRGTSAARRGQSFFAFNWGSVRHMKATSGLWVDDDEAPGARVSFEVPRPGGHDRRTSTMEHRLVPRFIKHHTNLANRSSLQRFLGGEIINAHQSLFWFGSHGPAFFTRAVRMIAVASMVILTIALETYYPRMLCIGVSDYGVCDQPTAGGIILLLISIIPPIISVMMLPQMIKKLVVITNVETMKDRQVILQVVNRTRNHNMRKVMATLLSLGNVIDRVRGLTELAKGNNGRGSAEFLRNSSEFVKNHAAKMGRGSFDARRVDSTTRGANEPWNGAMAKVGPTHISASDSSAVRRANEGGWDRSGNGRPSLEVASRVSLDFGKKIAKSTRTSLDSVFRNKRNSNSWDDPAVMLPPREEELKQFVAKMDKATVDNLRELFDEVDIGQTGALSKESLAKLLEATGTSVDEETCDFLFELMDLQRNGKVSFEEFASVFYQQKSRKQDPMQLADQIWNLLDSKNTGFITTVSVEATLNRTFPKYDTADILRLLRHLDYENLGCVDRSRFQQYVSTVFKEQALDV